MEPSRRFRKRAALAARSGLNERLDRAWGHYVDEAVVQTWIRFGRIHEAEGRWEHVFVGRRVPYRTVIQIDAIADFERNGSAELLLHKCSGIRRHWLMTRKAADFISCIGPATQWAVGNKTPEYVSAHLLLV